MTLNQIKKFEKHQKNISINVYNIEEKKYLSILSIRLADKKMDKHVNLLYVQNNKGTFRMDKKSISSRKLSKHNWVKKSTKSIFAIDTYTHLKKIRKYFIILREKWYISFCSCLLQLERKVESSCYRLRRNERLCDCRLPNDNDKWLSFINYCRKERVPYVVYADLECILKKTETEEAPSYMY